MNKKEIFIQAHIITRASVARFGGDYRVTFGAALSYFYKKEKGMDIEKLIAAGGREWQAGEHHRIYFNGLGRWLGLEYNTYNTGNISSASLRGERISNSEAKRILSSLVSSKIWFDIKAGEFRSKDISDDRFRTITAAIRAAAQ